MRATKIYRIDDAAKAIAFFCMLLFSVIGFSQAVNDYRSKAAGNWSALASWERWNGASWVQPTVGEGYPGQNSVSGAVTIRYAALFGFYSITLDVSPANNIGSLSVNTLVSLTTSGNPSLTVNGNLTVTALGTFTFGGTGNLSIGGTSTINGFFTDNNGTGISTFTGLVTMGAASTWTSTAVTTTGNLIFQNGITNNSISFSAGGATFNTNNQILSGATSATFANTVTLTVRLTNNLVSPDVLTISGDLAGAGQLTQGTNALVNIGGNATVAFLTATANPNTVTYNGSGAQSLKGTTYHHLTINKSAGTATPDAAFTCNGNLTINNAGTLASGGVLTHAVAGTTAISAGVLSTDNAASVFNLQDLTMTGGSIAGSATGSVNVGTTFTVPSGTATIGQIDFNVTGTVSVTGAVTFNSDLGIKDFFSLITINAGGSWNSTAIITPDNFKFRNGITQNGTSFSAGAAIPYVNSQTIDGTGSLSFANVVWVKGAGIIVTNNTTVSMTSTAINTLTGQGAPTWSQGATGVLNYSGETVDVAAISLNATAAGNSVNYNRTDGPQTVVNPVSGTYHHLTLSGTGNQTKTLSADVTVNGDLTIQNTAIFSVSTFDVNLKGNWNNSSTNADPLVEGIKTVTLSGTAGAQTISNTGNANGTVFYGLTFNNTSGTAPQIITSSNVTVSNTLTMTSGRVNLSGFTLTLGAAGTASTLVRTASTTTNWVYGGTLTRHWLNATAVTSTSGNYYGLFPMGASTASTYSPLEINTTSNPTANGSLSVTFTHVPNGGIDLSPFYNDAGTNIEFILVSSFVTAVSGVTGGTYNIDATLTGLNPAGALSDIRLAIFTGGTTASAVGTHAATTGTVINPTAKRTGLNIADLTTKDFRLATTNKGATPLPVEFLFLDARSHDNKVEVTWSTAAEFNSDYFLVQRSQDGISFEDVLQAGAAGNSSVVKNYSAVDTDPYDGTSYYRLKQVDNDGKFFYTGLVAVQFDKALVLSASPNPSAGPFNVMVEGKKGNPVLIVVRNAGGKEYFSQVLLIREGKETIGIDPAGKLAPGVYFITASSEYSIRQTKIVITK